MNDQRSNDDYQSSDIEGRGDDSPDYVLARLKQVEHDLSKHKRSWFRIPSNLISLLAVIFSVTMFAVTYVSETKELQFQKLQQLNQVIDQISSLAGQESEIYRTKAPPTVRANAFMAIANRRIALVNQADRLLADVDQQRVSHLELALMAPAYTHLGRYKDAEKSYLNLAKSKTEPLIVRVSAWRSLVSLYGSWGPEHIDDAKKAMSEGLTLIGRQANDIMLKGQSVMLPYMLAFNLVMTRSYDEALHFLLEAERNAWAMPCLPDRQEFLIMVRTEILKILPLYPDGQTVLNKSRAEYGQPCPNDQAIITTTRTAPHNETVSTSDYVGDYKSNIGIVLVRESTERLLQVSVGDKPAQTLVSVGDGIFVVQASLGYYLVFRRDDTGEVTRILFLQPNGVFSASKS